MSTERDKAILNSIFNPLLPLGETVYDEVLPENVKDEEIDSPECNEAKRLEVLGVESTESGDIARAIAFFTSSIAIAPRRPSGYNNRAQAYRLDANTELALADLDSAIELSGGEGRSGCQALCQRGTIHRKEGREEEARRDFQAAAKLGSDFAKTQIVEMNPYAALCNQMLREVIGKLK